MRGITNVYQGIQHLLVHDGFWNKNLKCHSPPSEEDAQRVLVTNQELRASVLWPTGNSLLLCRDVWVPHTLLFIVVLISSPLRIILENSEHLRAYTIKFPPVITNKNTHVRGRPSNSCSHTMLIKISPSGAPFQHLYVLLTGTH